VSISYKFYPERNLFVDKVEGRAGLGDILDIYTYVTIPGKFPFYNLVLSDIRNAELDLNFSQIPNLGGTIKGEGVTADFKWAILSSGKRATALSMSLEEFPGLESHIRVCSTVKGCAEFLGITFDEIELSAEDFTVFK